MDQIAVIADMVREAEKHADDQSADRIRALEYNQGVMEDTPSDEGRSSMVSRDVRAFIKKVLPSIVRTILGNDEIVEYSPGGPGDEGNAEQASDYINFVVLPESGGHQAIYDAVHDALLLRNGLLKWWFEEKREVEISRHSGLTEEAMAELVADDEVTVLEHSAAPVSIDGAPEPVMLHDVKIRRTYQSRNIRLAAFPRERLLIHPDAVTLKDSILSGEKTEITRSDLIAMGYDRELVDSLPLSEEDDVEEETRRDTTVEADEAQRANDLVDYYDLYIRVDMDDDGIAELRHMCFAGGLTERNLLINEECDEVQIADLCAQRQPHQWEGISLADDLMDIQRGKTVLLRETLDNLYWTNKPQPIAQKGKIKNWDAVLNPEFGLPIEVADGVDVRAALGFTQVPFVAKESFGMMEYLDNEGTERTGVSDASSGMAPDALQNMTAKASAMIEQAGIGQTEMIVRCIAWGLKDVFRGLLRLIVRHQDVPRTVRLRGEWVQVDPRQWNAKMDAIVNVGLGAGTRERDMAVMQMVMQVQEKLIGAFGPDNPFVTPENLYQTLSKMVESAGLKTASLYFTQPDPEEIARRLKEAGSKPSEAEMKAKAQMQIEQMKQQTQASKEKAQMEADLVVKQAEIGAETKRQENELASKAAIKAQEIAWEREKLEREQEFQRQQAAAQRQDEIWKAQAQGFQPSGQTGAS